MPGLSIDMIFWLAALVLFLIIEAATAGLVSVWFAAGALAALVVSLFHLHIWFQVAAFILVSAITLALTRSLAKKLLETKKRPTNVDMLYDMTGMVTEPIDNIAGSGAVKIAGKVWTARSYGGEPIAEGAVVRVKLIEGVKLIVQPVLE